jgi:hypothetical protein
MKMMLGDVRRVIAEAMLAEFGTPKGKLRPVRGGGGRQFKIGKVEEENQELSPVQAENMFPGSTEAWAEVVPDMFPEFPFADDPQVIKARTLWFKIGGQLRVAFSDMPQIELATWDPTREDWFPLEAA